MGMEPFFPRVEIPRQCGTCAELGSLDIPYSILASFRDLSKAATMGQP
jgi:hypothetical protein